MPIPLDSTFVALVRECYAPIYRLEGLNPRLIDAALATFACSEATPSGFRRAIQDHLRAHIKQLQGARAREERRLSIDDTAWQAGWCS